MFSMAELEHQLVLYISAENFTNPFDLMAVPIISKEESDAQSLLALMEHTSGGAVKSVDSTPSIAVVPAITTQTYAKALAEVPEFRDFGAILKSSNKAIELTEEGTEYTVTALKHIFQEHIVLQVEPSDECHLTAQFNVTNTLADTILENVFMLSTSDDESLVEEFIIPAPLISSSESSILYISFSRSSAGSFDTATFSNVLKFTSKEVDPEGVPEEQGYDDEYEVEALSLGPGDYFLPTYIGNFQGAWDSYGANVEVSETFALTSMKSIQGYSLYNAY